MGDCVDPTFLTFGFGAHERVETADQTLTHRSLTATDIQSTHSQSVSQSLRPSVAPTHSLTHSVRCCCVAAAAVAAAAVDAVVDATTLRCCNIAVGSLVRGCRCLLLTTTTNFFFFFFFFFFCCCCCCCCCCCRCLLFVCSSTSSTSRLPSWLALSSTVNVFGICLFAICEIVSVCFFGWALSVVALVVGCTEVTFDSGRSSSWNSVKLLRNWDQEVKNIRIIKYDRKASEWDGVLRYVSRRRCTSCQVWALVVHVVCSCTGS